MNNITKYKQPKSPTFKFDWNSIDDGSQRLAAKSVVEAYERTHHQNRAKIQGHFDKVNDIVVNDNVDKARAVYSLKLSLNHGDFLSVCEQALSIKKDNAAALASSGKIIVEEGVSDVEEKMFQQMEPQAGRKFLRAEPETKHRYVTTFEETGRVPSQRSFTTPKVEPTPVTEVVTAEPLPVVPIIDRSAEVEEQSIVVEQLKHALAVVDSVRANKQDKDPKVASLLKSLGYTIDLILGNQSFRR